MNPLKYLGLMVLLAGFHFGAVYFAVSALVPSIALQAGLVAWILALAIYQYLRSRDMDEEGLPMGLLIFSPVIFIAVGVIWWAMRLLGFWGN